MCYHYVTTVTTAIPLIWLNKDQNCPKKGYNYEIYLLQLEDK